jgi:magnesium transporter
MPYISELLHKQVTDSSDSLVGRLEDILISPKNGEFSPLKFLVIRAKDKTLSFVPFEFVENFNSTEIRLKNLFLNIAKKELPKEIFIYLKKEVLDRQIVDISGTRIVRVDDLRIGNFEGKMSVLGIDTSFRGLMRRIGLDNFILSKFFKAHFIDWRQAQLLDGGPLQLNSPGKNFTHLHPADLANIVEELDVKRGTNLLTSLDEKQAAKVLEELDTDQQNIFVKYLGPEKAVKILAEMSSDEITDLAKTFSESEASEFFSKLGIKSQNIKKLIEYGDNTAGGLMSVEFVSMLTTATAEEAIEEVKKQSPIFRSIFFVYVTDEEGKFEGVVSLRRMITAKQGATMKDLAKNLRSHLILRPTDKIQKIIKLMTRYNLFSAAVVDKNKKLVGVVTIDDVMNQLFPSA